MADENALRDRALWRNYAKKWWNTTGQLGPYGAKALARGFPRTHFFAQARSVFAVASHRCAQVFDPPDSVTIWKLTETIEDQFDGYWEAFLDDAADRRDQAIWDQVAILATPTAPTWPAGRRVGRAYSSASVRPIRY